MFIGGLSLVSWVKMHLMPDVNWWALSCPLMIESLRTDGKTEREQPLGSSDFSLKTLTAVLVVRSKFWSQNMITIFWVLYRVFSCCWKSASSMIFLNNGRLDMSLQIFICESALLFFKRGLIRAIFKLCGTKRCSTHSRRSDVVQLKML